MLFLLCQTLTEISFHPGRLVFFELSHCTAKKRNYDPLQQKNPRDKVSLQKKVRILNRLIKAGAHQATSCSNTSQQPIVLCVLETFCETFYHCNRIMSCNKSYKIRSDWICLTCGGKKFCCWDKISTKILQYTHKAICRCTVSCNLAPAQYTHSDLPSDFRAKSLNFSLGAVMLPDVNF